MYGYIYKITNKVTGQTYIGQTTVGFKKRYCRKGKGIERVYKYYHSLKKHGYKINELLYNEIAKYGFDNFDVSEQYDCAFSQTELDIKEQIYIKLYGSYNFLTVGKHTKYSDLDKKKMSDITKGRKLTDIHKKRIASGRIGKYSKENSYVNKKVMCIETGITYYSISNAKELTGIDDSCIAKCCKGKRKTAGKFHWKYV